MKILVNGKDHELKYEDIIKHWNQARYMMPPDDPNDITQPQFKKQLISNEEALDIFGQDYIPSEQLAAREPWYDPANFRKTNVHQHEWVMYTGLAEQFEHCKGCGVKK